MKRLRLISNIISVLLIGGYVVFLTAFWRDIPETVPTHFNALGKADAYGSKGSLIAEVVIMASLFLLLAVVEWFPSAWNFPVKLTAENKARLYAIGFAMIGAMKVLMVCMFINVGLSSIFADYPVWPLYLLLVLIPVVIITGIIACVRAR
jgi:uncharacterized membrane protein